ncbi:MAG TPA: hypothetical protein VFH88_11640, partial [Candidatus Krumholzibacteria bacterium]|nr:hypothetical protein [Candidatus Krumholzibacteria bacterium]
ARAPAPRNGDDEREPAAPLWGKSSWSGKNDPPGEDLDVGSAVSDRNVGRDEKLRTLGWEKYGRRLKHHADSGKLKESGGDHDDHHEDDGGDA